MLLPALEGDFAVVTLSGWGSPRLPKQASNRTWPAEIVAECLDREAAHDFGDLAGGATVAPRTQRGSSAGASHRAAVHREQRREHVVAISNSFPPPLGAGLRMVRARQRLRQCAKQSETILSIVQQWSHTQEMETLLNQMAEASTQLTGSRSSEHLFVGSDEPHAGRSAGAGRAWRRAANARRCRRRGRSVAHRRTAASFAARDA